MHVRVLAALALVLELVGDGVGVAAGDHGQLGVCQRGLAGVDLPDAAVAVPDAVEHPDRSVAHLMDQRVPQPICRDRTGKLSSKCVVKNNS